MLSLRLDADFDSPKGNGVIEIESTFKRIGHRADNGKA
jgi:hypothetical protein